MASPEVPLLFDESVALEHDLDEPLATESPPDLAPSQLELLPPSEDESLDSTSGFEESEADADDAVSAQALREELSRKEEELINQQQQHTYLEQRLQELESQLADSREGTVEDKNLAGMEERLRQERLRDAQTEVPKVVSSPRPEEPWYNRISLWLVGLLVLAAALAGWFMSRRSGSDTVVSDPGKAPDPLREIKEEAKKAARERAAKEKVSYEEVAQEEATEESMAEQPEPPDTGEPEDVQAAPAGKKLVDEDEEDADVPDEESADPEIQLDLARAYVSMGDKEAARVILEEIIAHGSEQQQAEAIKMKEAL